MPSLARLALAPAALAVGAALAVTERVRAQPCAECGRRAAQPAPEVARVDPERVRELLRSALWTTGVPQLVVGDVEAREAWIDSATTDELRAMASVVGVALSVREQEWKALVGDPDQRPEMSALAGRIQR